MKRGLYMGLNTSAQQFVERLNDLNRYLLYFPEENPKQLDQDEIIEILDQAKARDPEWHEAMVNANFDIFEFHMKNQFLISSVWITWRRSGTPRQLKLKKSASIKKRKAESLLLLSTEIKLTTSSDEGEELEYFFIFLLIPVVPAKLSWKNYLTKQWFTEIVMRLIVNNQEHLLRALADTGTSSNFILEVSTPVPFIKTDENNTTTWNTIGGHFTKTKTGIFLWDFHPQSSISRK
jgi:hypothetical protein